MVAADVFIIGDVAVAAFADDVAEDVECGGEDEHEGGKEEEKEEV